MSIVNLPSGYRQVEYIESTGTQFVDTGFKPNGNTRVVCDFQITKAFTASAAVFGARDGSTTYLYVFYHISTNAFRTDYYGNYQNISVTNALARMTVDKNKNVTTIDGNSLSYTAVTTQTPYNLYLFAVNQANTATSNANVRIYSCQIYDNGTLIRNFVPCINPSGVVGLYDLVNAKFYGNSGTGIFTAGRKVYKESEVAKLEYIESDGSQYVDTGFKPNNNTRIVMEARFVSASPGNVSLFGARTSATSKNYALHVVNGAIRSDYNNAYSQTWSVTLTNKLSYDKNKETTIINGISQSYTNVSFQCDYNLFLFALNNAGSATMLSKLEVYSCQIYDNGTLTRDYYPAEVDGEIGLWDAISGVLYTDAAGGTFIAGPYLAVDTPANFEQILAVYLRWGAVDCEAYKIYRNGSLIGTTTDTFYVDITAEQNTEYTYTLVAYREATESEPTELTVYTRSGYFVIKPLIESAFFQ